MPRTSSPSSSAPAAIKTGEELTRSVAGNVIEQHSLAPHPQEQHAEHDEEERNRRIAIAAYYRAERRGFAPGGELEDWLEAEREVSESAGAGGIG